MRKIEKDLYIETLRGIAIILMVAGHVIGDDKDAGMKVSDNSGFRYFYYIFEYLRMPLFTVISGYVYSMRPLLDRDKLAYFINKKFKRLMIPFLFCSTLFFLVQYFTPGTNMNKNLTDIWKIYFFSYAHFWFIQSIFLIFIIAAFIEVSGLLSSITNWILLMFICFLPFLSGVSVDFFSITKTLYLLPYFILGIGLYRFRDTVFKQKAGQIALISVFVISFITQQVLFFVDQNIDLIFIRLLRSVVAVSGITCLISLKFSCAPLQRLGYYSFMIYLYHVFATASVRILSMRLGFDNDVLVFSLSLVAGLLFPIILYNIVGSFPVLKLVMFGEGVEKKNKIQSLVT